MPRYPAEWIREVIEYNMRRQPARRERSRGLHSLRSRIEEWHSGGRVAIIAEYKTRSPSGLRAWRDPIEYLRLVERCSVGVSVLTEELYFGGSYDTLALIASSTSLPVLMKDIVVSPAQIESAFNLGADAILLIASLLTDRELDHLYEEARSRGLEVLVEVHDEEEAERVVSAGYPMIGVNARNLATLTIDLMKAYKVLELIPMNKTKVAESGIRGRSDIEFLRKAGAKAFLIGTTLMLDPERIEELCKV